MAKQSRQPIVTILGHVDHGKTTLLDTIRDTHIADREAGGITQSIGASQITTPEGNITFIDTPGHAAFSTMRERGAKVADIAILVVAADDGPMPQTKEALEYIRTSETPYIIAFTKMDLASANLDSAMGKMEQLGVAFEGRGGDVPFVKVSAKDKQGLPELLEMIQLVSQVQEISADADAHVEAVVIETNKDQRGSVVSAVVRNGTLKVGNEVMAGGQIAKVRGLFNEKNKPVKEALPGDPVVMLGFTTMPEVGETIIAKEVGELAGHTVTLKQGEDVPDVEEGQLPVILKAQSAGSLEALVASMPSDVIVMRSDVGDFTESDVFFAKTSGSAIIGFESKIPSQVQKLAETDGIEMHTFKIIYELIQYLEQEVEKRKTKILGLADILDSFPFNKVRIACCKVRQGSIKVKDKPVILRNREELGQVTVISIRKQKSEVPEVKEGEECGILFKPQLDFQAGDMIVSLRSNGK
jgi:translation initiation factor IF-2